MKRRPHWTGKPLSGGFSIRALRAVQIMQSAAFKLGVREVRNAIPPDYDRDDQVWQESYECGRQWAWLAGTTPVYRDGQVTQQAIQLFLDNNL